MKEYKNLINFFTSLLLVLGLFFIIFNCYIYLKCYSISQKIILPENQEFMRIKIYGSSSTYEGNTVSGVFSILDTNGNEISWIERSWSGSYLSVEFGKCKIAGKIYIFPERIYGKENIIEKKSDRKSGTLIEKYYNENGQCMILGFGSKKRDRQNLYTMARFATRKLPVLSFGTVNTTTIDLSSCKTDIYYSIKRDSSGNLFIEEL